MHPLSVFFFLWALYLLCCDTCYKNVESKLLMQQNFGHGVLGGIVEMPLAHSTVDLLIILWKAPVAFAAARIPFYSGVGWWWGSCQHQQSCRHSCTMPFATLNVKWFRKGVWFNLDFFFFFFIGVFYVLNLDTCSISMRRATRKAFFFFPSCIFLKVTCVVLRLPCSLWWHYV